MTYKLSASLVTKSGRTVLTADFKLGHNHVAGFVAIHSNATETNALG